VTYLLTSINMVAPETVVSGSARDVSGVVIGPPEVDDGVACHRLAAATGVLDVNSRYAYLLWCRDFAATSVVARCAGRFAGFVTGFRRPDEPRTLVVWQVAVDDAARGRGLAAAMLDALLDQVPEADHLETTITPDNAGSVALFTGFARRHGARLHRSELFGSDLLGDGHLPELLFRIGPITQG
jgi:L-2,4-diaminobutyric acid acetyltransferase